MGCDLVRGASSLHVLTAHGVVTSTKKYRSHTAICGIARCVIYPSHWADPYLAARSAQKY